MKRFLLVLVVLAGCGGDDAVPADPAAAQADIDTLLPSLVDDTSDSFDGAAELESVQGYRDSMDALNHAFPELPFRFPLGNEVLAKMVPQTTERPGAELARFLREKVFTAANYEGDGVFRVRGSALCEVDGEIDADCVKAIDDAELRIRVTRSGGGLDFVLLVGPMRAAPIVLELRRDSIDLTLDLGEAKEAVKHLASVAGEEIDLPATFEGSVSLRLERLGSKHVAIEVAVRKAVKIGGSSADGAYSVNIASRDPLLKVELNVPAKKFLVDLDIGPVTINMPWGWADAESLAHGALAIDWRGVTADVVFDTATGTLVVGGITLGEGTSTAKLDGKTLLGIDVAPFSLQVAPRPVGLPRFVLNPGIDVKVTVALKPLRDAGDEVADWALDEVFTIEVGKEVEPRQEAIKAIKGSISVAATKAGASVTAAEGQCLRGDDVTAGEHPVIGQFAAVPCL